MLTLTTSAKLVRDLQFRSLGVTCSDFSNGCEKPIEIALRGKPDAITLGLKMEADRDNFHTITAPCRKCRTCLNRRSKRWAAKAHTECKASSRTWFCTFTVEPQQRFLFKLAAQAHAERRGCIWAKLTSADKFEYIHGQIGPEITKFLKRIRKNSGAKLRYLLVVEPHKDGFPHYHMLLHEFDKPVRHAMLTDNWKHGFTRFKVVDTDRAPWYVCKYMAKTALCRIRASQQYGPHAGRSLTERVIAATRSLVEAKSSPPACRAGPPIEFD